MKKNKRFFQIFFCALLAVGCCGCAGVAKMDLNIADQRTQAVDAYLAEFSSPSLMRSRIGPAIRDVMMRIPVDALSKVMNRRRPVMFVEVASSGTAKFASSAEVMMTEQDAPAYQEGMTLIMISDALSEGTPEAIEGIVAHELAHRVMDNIRNNHISCQAEREANRLIKSWGFNKEYQNASQEFGQAKVGDGVAGCQEVPNEGEGEVPGGDAGAPGP